MKSFLRFLKWALLGLVALVILFYAYVSYNYQKKFDAPYPEISASTDPAVIERGRELALGPAHCAHCHAPMSEFARYEAGEDVPLSGGFDFVLPFGTLHTPNITSDKETGIGNLTDGEIARSLRYGVDHNGEAMFDFMPFYDVSDEDLTAIISWLRTLPPVSNKRPKNEYNFVGKVLKTFMLEPTGDGVVDTPPVPSESAEYGKYLVTSVANCQGCHSPRDLMTGAYTGPKLSGGLEMEVMDENGIVAGKHLVTPNLTPNPETGVLTEWSKDAFIQRIRTGATIKGTPMPWASFGRMSDRDLTAIYNYLISIEPVENEVPVGIQDGDPNA